MKKIILSMAGVWGMVSLAWGQYTTELHTASSSSASYESASLMIDYTIGELAAVTTIGGDKFTLTQGLHQPDKFTVGMDDWNKPWHKFSAWPNPASGTLFLETDIMEDLYLSIFDATGRLLRQVELHGQSTTPIDISSFSAGTYTLVVVSKSSKDRIVIPFIRAYQ